MSIHSAVPVAPPRRFGVGSRQVRRRPFDLAGWKHEQRLRAVVVLCALGMFFLFAPYVVVFFVPDQDLHLLRDLNKSPEAVRIVIFLVICKMVGLGTIFCAMPFFFRTLFDDPAPPAPPEDIVRSEPRKLARATRNLLAHGHASIAEVTQVDWPEVTLRWSHPGGCVRTPRLTSPAPDLAPPEPGERLHVLYDPLDPDDVVAPRLLDVCFTAPDVVEDLRPVDLPPAEPLREPTPLALTLQPTLRPVPRAFWPSVRRAVTRSLRTSPHGQGMVLQLDDCALHGPACSLRLDRPFYMGLSAWLARPGVVEVAVSLRERGADGASVTFRVEQAMENVARCVPVQRSDAPWVTPGQFAPLWGALRFYLAAQGDSLDGQLRIETHGR